MQCNEKLEAQSTDGEMLLLVFSCTITITAVQRWTKIMEKVASNFQVERVVNSCLPKSPL